MRQFVYLLVYKRFKVLSDMLLMSTYPFLDSGRRQMSWRQIRQCPKHQLEDSREFRTTTLLRRCTTAHLKELNRSPSFFKVHYMGWQTHTLFMRVVITTAWVKNLGVPRSSILGTQVEPPTIPSFHMKEFDKRLIRSLYFRLQFYNKWGI